VDPIVNPPLPERPLVSVVMPAHNAAPWVADAIRSVQAQTWTRWELIIVDDGSTDDIARVLASFTDARIHVLRQPKGGVSAARNKALDRCSGNVVCFLDADDRMPARSMEARLELLKNDPRLSFADGAVSFFDRELSTPSSTWSPSFAGEPFPLLIRFDPSCFFGNTWMIRREAIGTVRFDPSVSHAEDLLFFMNIAPGRRYGFTEEMVLDYRRTGSSSMMHIDRLEHGYRRVLDWMRSHPDLVSADALRYATRRVKRMISGSYWHTGEWWAALKAWLR
jgi:glycosyltransferase involved in cell wall biosynthesis